MFIPSSTLEHLSKRELICALGVRCSAARIRRMPVQRLFTQNESSLKASTGFKRGLNMAEGGAHDDSIRPPTPVLVVNFTFHRRWAVFANRMHFMFHYRQDYYD